MKVCNIFITSFAHFDVRLKVSIPSHSIHPYRQTKSHLFIDTTQIPLEPFNPQTHMTSQVFLPFRSLGVVTNSVPFHLFSVKTEDFVALSTGKSYQVLGISFSSCPLPSPPFTPFLLSKSLLKGEGEPHFMNKPIMDRGGKQ